MHEEQQKLGTAETLRSMEAITLSGKTYDHTRPDIWSDAACATDMQPVDAGTIRYSRKLDHACTASADRAAAPSAEGSGGNAEGEYITAGYCRKRMDPVRSIRSDARPIGYSDECAAVAEEAFASLAGWHGKHLCHALV